jgi:peroxiredoxin Q/BCP
LRDDFAAFTARDAVILTVGPDGPKSFARYWANEHLPFIGLPDPKHVVANLYGQEVNLFKLGRIPALMLIDRKGRVRYQHYSNSMSDIPENDLILGMLDKMNNEL